MCHFSPQKEQVAHRGRLKQMTSRDKNPSRPAELRTCRLAPEEMSLTLIEEQADASIRRVWRDGKCFFSVIDVIGVLTSSAAPRKYFGLPCANASQKKGFEMRLQNVDACSGDHATASSARPKAPIWRRCCVLLR